MGFPDDAAKLLADFLAPGRWVPTGNLCQVDHLTVYVDKEASGHQFNVDEDGPGEPDGTFGARYHTPQEAGDHVLTWLKEQIAKPANGLAGLRD